MVASLTRGRYYYFKLIASYLILPWAAYIPSLFCSSASPQRPPSPPLLPPAPPTSLWNAGFITDGMVTASSEVVNYGDPNGLCMANTSRLCHHCVDHNTRFNALGVWPNTWCASSKATIDSGGTEWIQVDFGAPTVATVLAVEIQGRYPGPYWGNVNSIGFEVQSSACAQDPSCDEIGRAHV